jgi:hypothetical protein
MATNVGKSQRRPAGALPTGKWRKVLPHWGLGFLPGLFRRLAYDLLVGGRPVPGATLRLAYFAPAVDRKQHFEREFFHVVSR